MADGAVDRYALDTNLRPRKADRRVDGGIASTVVEKTERGVALRPRQVMRTHVRQRDPDWIRNTARAVIADRAIFEILLVGRKFREDRLHQPLDRAPGERPRGDEASEQRDDSRTRGAALGARLHPSPRQIKKDRLRRAEDEIEQRENDVVSADRSHEDSAGEPADHREDRIETMGARIDRGGNIKTGEKDKQHTRKHQAN